MIKSGLKLGLKLGLKPSFQCGDEQMKIGFQYGLFCLMKSVKTQISQTQKIAIQVNTRVKNQIRVKFWWPGWPPIRPLIDDQIRHMLNAERLKRPLKVRDLLSGRSQFADPQILRRVDIEVGADVQTLIKVRIWSAIDESCYETSPR